MRSFSIYSRGPSAYLLLEQGHLVQEQAGDVVLSEGLGEQIAHGGAHSGHAHRPAAGPDMVQI